MRWKGNRLLRVLCFALAYIYLPTGSGAQSARLVQDLAPPIPHANDDSSPVTLGTVQGRHVFYTETLRTPSFVWSSDGSKHGTVALPVHCDDRPCSIHVALLGTTPTRLYFSVAEEPTGPFHIFSTDGTPEGTSRLPIPGGLLYFPPDANNGFRLTATVGESLLFPLRTADYPSTYYLVASNGTSEGTITLCETAGLASSIQLEDRVLAFSGSDLEPTPAEIWSTDGTVQGTFQLSGIPPFRYALNPTAAGSLVYFAATSIEGKEIWRTDGTSSGTLPLSRFADPNAEVAAIRTSGPRAVAIVNDVTQGSEIWLSDGSVGGTRPATAFPYHQAIVQDSLKYSFLSLGSRAIFMAQTGLEGGLLYSVGIADGELILVDRVCSEGCASWPYFHRVGSRAFFQRSSASGEEPWVTDGTVGGTRLLADICPGPCSSSPNAIVSDGMRLIFGAHGSEDETWVTSGTPESTLRLTSPVLGAPAGAGTIDLNRWTEAGGLVLFPGRDTAHGIEPWVTDLSSDSAMLVTDLAAATKPSLRQEIGGLAGRAVFSAEAATDFSERFWFLGGELEGIEEVQPTLVPYRSDSDKEELFELGDRVVYIPADPQFVQSIDSEGNAEELARPQFYHQMGEPAVLGDIFFVASDAGPAEIWSTDGTATGTRHRLTDEALISGVYVVNSKGLLFRYVGDGVELASLSADATSLQTVAALGAATGLGRIAPYNSPLGFFARADSSLSATVYRTNGQPGSVAPLPTGEQTTGLLAAARFGNDYLLLLQKLGDRPELWRSDGTASGTQFITSFSEHAEATQAEITTVGGAALVFFGTYLTEALWVTDGTAAGTARLGQPYRIQESRFQRSFVNLGSRVLFVASDLEHGFELWTTDGSLAGTKLVQDINPGPDGSYPYEFHKSGSVVYFFADDGVHGRELWVFDPETGSTCRSSETALCLQQSSFRAEVHWRAFDGSEGDALAVALSSDTGYFWFFDPSNVEAIVKVLDGRGANGHHWVYYGALSNVEYNLTITNTETGASKRYFNPVTRFASSGDITAFGPDGAHTAGAMLVEETKAAAASMRDRLVPYPGFGSSGTCLPSSTRFCILGSRFAVEATWRDFEGHTGVASAGTITDDTGYLWFFNEANVEVVLKAIDGGGLNDHFWIFYGALSNVEYTITVTDTVAGTSRIYRNPLGSFGSFGDIEAFPAD